MNLKSLFRVGTAVCSLFTAVNPLFALGTAFTYQGRLDNAGSPASGNYDYTFALFNNSVAGAQAGTTVTNLNVAVSNGVFTTTIDFGPSLFDGTPYWLAIGVRSNGSPVDFTALTPRQEVTPSPYAIYAATAPVTDNSVTSAKILDGTVASADLANDAVTTGNILNGTLTSADIADGAITTNDLSLASVDARYALKAGDTMTGNLNVLNAGNSGDITIENTFPFLTFNRNSTLGNSGILFSDKRRLCGVD